MNPLLIGGLVAGGLDLAGDVFSATSARNAFKTRYQDTVKDMRKAGLNPALAYGQGGGNPQTVPIGETGSAALEGAHKAASAKHASQQAALATATTEKIKAETDLLKQQTADLALQPGLTNARIASDTNVADRTAELRGNQRDQAKADATVAINTVRARITSAKARAAFDQLSLPEQRAVADFFTKTGSLNKFLGSAATLATILGRAR